MREPKQVIEALRSAVNKKKGPEHEGVRRAVTKDAQDSGGGGLRIPSVVLERRGG
jgi:hypothetical protein